MKQERGKTPFWVTMIRRKRILQSLNLKRVNDNDENDENEQDHGSSSSDPEDNEEKHQNFSSLQDLQGQSDHIFSADSES